MTMKDRMLASKSNTSVYIAALKIVDVRNIYLHADQYQCHGWKASPPAAKAPSAVYLNSSGSAKAELLNAGYKTAYSILASNAKKGIFRPPPTDGWIDYFKDRRSPFNAKAAILRGKQAHKAVDWSKLPERLPTIGTSQERFPCQATDGGYAGADHRRGVSKRSVTYGIAPARSPRIATSSTPRPEATPWF
jgi:hypothetical protein